MAYLTFSRLCNAYLREWIEHTHYCRPSCGVLHRKVILTQIFEIWFCFKISRSSKMPSTFLIFNSVKIFSHYSCCSVINGKRFIASACRLCIFRQRNTPRSILNKILSVNNSIIFRFKISIFLMRVIRIYHINRNVIRCCTQCC